MNASKTLIKESQLAEFLRVADSWVTKVEWQPQASAPAPGDLQRQRLQAQTQPTPTASLVENLKQVRKDGSTYLGEAEYRVLYACRRGIQICMAVAKEYSVLEGTDRMGEPSRLGSDKKTELQEKARTAAGIALFTLARFAAEHLTGQNDDEAHREHIVLPESVFDDPVVAIRCALFYLSANILHPKVNNDKALTSTVRFFFEKVIGEVLVRKATFKHLERFQKITFGLEGSDFTIEGLERREAGVVYASVNPVQFEDIVGNRVAKHIEMRSIDQLALYDTKLKKRGEALGFQPVYHELPKDSGSEFQNKTSEKWMAWFARFRDKSKIIYGLMDDAESDLKGIEGSHSSESGEAKVAVFLTSTEGASAPKAFNWVLDVRTNLPEKIYQPIMSRIQNKFEIEGAVTVEDYLDQERLVFGKIDKQEIEAEVPKEERFDDMVHPEGYVYMSTQGHLINLAQLYEREPVEPKLPVLRNILMEVRKLHKENEHKFYAELFARVKAAFPKSFSSRDVRNIDVSINARRMDFDIPEDWLEKRSAFMDLDFGLRVKMLMDLQRQSLKGLRLSGVRLQETMRYLNALLSIPENARLREIAQQRDGIVSALIAEEQARNLIKDRGGIAKLATE